MSSGNARARSERCRRGHLSGQHDLGREEAASRVALVLREEHQSRAVEALAAERPRASNRRDPAADQAHVVDGEYHHAGRQHESRPAAREAQRDLLVVGGGIEIRAEDNGDEEDGRPDRGAAGLPPDAPGPQTSGRGADRERGPGGGGS